MVYTAAFTMGSNYITTEIQFLSIVESDILSAVRCNGGHLKINKNVYLNALVFMLCSPSESKTIWKRETDKALRSPISQIQSIYLKHTQSLEFREIV